MRDVTKAAVVAAELGLTKDSYSIMQVELASLASVNAFAEKLLKGSRKIDVLVCNAAVYLPNQQEPTYTEDGYEMSFGVNHLAHHLLVRKMLPELKKNKGRCIIVGSITGNSNTVGGGAVLPLADLGTLAGAARGPLTRALLSDACSTRSLRSLCAQGWRLAASAPWRCWTARCSTAQRRTRMRSCAT